MKKLLRIDSSSRFEGSNSRGLADIFEKKWLNINPAGEVIVREIIKKPLPHIADETIKAFYTPVDQLSDIAKSNLKVSDELIAEIKSADDILISAPMYNFSVPSALKAWIDQIVRPGFTFDSKNFTGLIPDKKVYLCLSYGGEGYSAHMSSMDFLKPYLKALFGFLGVKNIEFFALEGTHHSDSLRAKIEQAKAHMDQVLNS